MKLAANLRAFLQDRLHTPLESGRLHHALLLTGAEGVGKRDVANWIARSLLCSDGPVAGGCGACGACHRIDGAIHPDLLNVERPAGKAAIPVDLIRGTIDELGRSSLEGRGRVAVVLEADRLNREGQNALLKTLEEPAPKTWLLLTAARPEALLDTVLSRSQRIGVPPLSDADLVQMLETEHGVDPGSAQRAATLACGSTGRALALLSEGLPELERLCLSLLAADRPAAPSWARSVLDGAAAGEAGVRQAKRRRAAEILRLTTLLLRERAATDARAWDAIEAVLLGLEELDLDLGAELVLANVHARVGACMAGA